MTSKAVSRSCEDIDEATLSYAEIKAVATGNPLIKEKMEIDNDVQRLKLLKASYDNQRYGLQDNFMIKYPKLIKTATEKLANVREDVKARDKELIDNPEFAITIGKATYTERVDGGTMMLEAISKCKTGETTAIGKFHGFELLVEKNFLGINYMVLRGKTEYKAELSTSPVGSMVKLENLFNGLHENIDFLEKKIEQYQNDLEASKTEYDKPFAYSTELEEKLARQCELNAQLDLENAKAGTANKKKETAQTTENTKLKENTTESIAEKNLSKAAQKMLENLRGSRNDMDFMVADFENGDNAKDILAQSDKEYTVIFSKEEMEKMASDPKYYAEKMHSIEGVLRMTDEINAQFGFERAFGKTNDNADADTKITKFGISFNSDGTTTFFAQLEKSSASQKEYLEKLQEKKAAEKKEAKKKEQSKQTEVRKTTVQANSKEELLDKIKNIDWDSIKPEENKIGGRFDFSI